MLKRSEILDIAPNLPRVVVNVPEWGGSVTVRGMTAGERDRFEMIVAEGKRANFRAWLAVFTVCDASGQRLFEDGDVSRLTAQPAAALDRISDAAIALSRFTKADVEEMEKNSEGGPSSDSS